MSGYLEAENTPKLLLKSSNRKVLTYNISYVFVDLIKNKLVVFMGLILNKSLMSGYLEAENTPKLLLRSTNRKVLTYNISYICICGSFTYS